MLPIATNRFIARRHSKARHCTSLLLLFIGPTSDFHTGALYKTAKHIVKRLAIQQKHTFLLLNVVAKFGQGHPQRLVSVFSFLVSHLFV